MHARARTQRAAQSQSIVHGARALQQTSERASVCVCYTRVRCPTAWTVGSGLKNLQNPESCPGLTVGRAQFLECKTTTNRLLKTSNEKITSYTHYK